MRLRGAGRGEELVPAGQLHSRSAVRLAPRALDCVDRLPARVHDDLDATAGEQLFERPAVALGKPTRSRVLEEQLDRLRSVLLVRADGARRSAFDPSGAIEAFGRRAALVEDASFGI